MIVMEDIAPTPIKTLLLAPVEVAPLAAPEVSDFSWVLCHVEDKYVILMFEYDHSKSISSIIDLKSWV